MPSQSSTPTTRRKRNAAIATIASTDPEFMTPAQLHLRQMIVDSAEEAFRQHGIKKVTMDEVAKNIHMSKRTLYQFFRDKEELVLACVKSTLDREQEFANQAAMRCENALQLIFDVMQYRMTDAATTSEYYFRDITIYPTVTQYFKMRRAQCTARFIELLHIGVQQGLFVDTINFEVFGGCMSLISEATSKMSPSLTMFVTSSSRSSADAPPKKDAASSTIFAKIISRIRGSQTLLCSPRSGSLDVRD